VPRQDRRAGTDDTGPDHYRVLGVPPSASGPEITRAYRRLARQVHPDAGTTAGDVDAFTGAAAAYAVLGDPEARRRYDRARSRGRPAPGGRSADAVRIPVRVRPAGPVARAGSDVRAPVRLRFDGAVLGATVEVPVPGRGTVRAHLPAGVEDGQAVRIPGHGAPGAAGGPPGDLLLDVSVARHPRLGRDGPHLTARMPVGFPQAVLGTDLVVPTPAGDVAVRVPAGTPSGAVLRVAGAGVRGPAGAGDLLVTVEVQVPRRVTTAQRAAIEQLAALLPEPPYPGPGT
jgi:DnaJ-class molecular chaperone